MILQNLLIEAGAGTGKTTRLVKALLEALFVREIPLDQLVALTFTNKAAGELKERVSFALDDILKAPDLDTLRQKPWWFSSDYFSSLSHLKELAQNALGVLDRTNISTIHSFAYSLIRRFPLAAGVNPDSEIDDKGLRFDELFRKAWPLWLSVELADHSPREGAWLDLLSQMTLGEIETAARRLSDFEAPVEYLPLLDDDLPTRLEPLYHQARTLAAEHAGTLVADRMVQACEEILGAASRGAWEKLDTLNSDTRNLLEKSPGTPKTWGTDELETLGTLHLVARNLLKRGDRVIALLTELLKPFVVDFRNGLLSDGCLSHSALLFLSRELVRTKTDIREQLKKEIRLILIDEFQDTDPLQAELLLFLAEAPGYSVTAWTDICLEPGKLFIVGDPKQSIYRFRGADIAAYQQIGAQVIRQGGRQESLATNYRSQAQIIEVVNTAFEKLMQPVPNISPPYIAVKSHHAHEPLLWPVQDVDVWVATSPGHPQTAEESQDTEAEAVAEWIVTHVGQKEIPVPLHPNLPSGKRTLTYRDIALIFRTYGPMDRYIDALRRRNIPFAVESERFFFSTPEITDFLNLLRTIADPADERSKIGFLKGPLAAVTDKELLEHKHAGTLDDLEPLEWVRSLHDRLKKEPLSAILQAIFEDSFLLELGARSYHGDQAVANLLKIRRLLEELSLKGDRTMSDLLERLDEFFEEDRLEGESPLADESYDAVRILTIHKAKGLEFPVVFLPSLHSEIRPHRKEQFVFDWRNQQLGLETGGGFANLDKILLDRQARIRDAAEQQRILYVAMTRAKQRLILSGGIDLKLNKSGTFLNRLAGAWGFSLPDCLDGTIAVGNAHLTLKRLPPVHVDRSTSRPVIDRSVPPFDPEGFAAIWRERAHRSQGLQALPIVRTPSAAGQYPSSQELLLASRADPPDEEGLAHVSAADVGILVHRFLQNWDFSSPIGNMPQQLKQTAQHYFRQQGLPEALEIETKAQQLLKHFLMSPDYEEIRQSHIVGREVPFFYDDSSSDSRSGVVTLCRGTMDLIYRLPDGRLVIADYKTGSNVASHVAQGEAYVNAVQKALSETAEFKAIYLKNNEFSTANDL